jgi:hypothetical protein
VSVIRCACGDERDVHALKRRAGRWYRGECTNTKCGCAAFQEAEEVVEPVDSRVFTAARERIAKAIAETPRMGGSLDSWSFRVADAVLALVPAERVAELFPEERTS